MIWLGYLQSEVLFSKVLNLDAADVSENITMEFAYQE